MRCQLSLGLQVLPYRAGQLAELFLPLRGGARAAHSGARRAKGRLACSATRAASRSAAGGADVHRRDTHCWAGDGWEQERPRGAVDDNGPGPLVVPVTLAARPATASPPPIGSTSPRPRQELLHLRNSLPEGVLIQRVEVRRGAARAPVSRRSSPVCAGAGAVVCAGQRGELQRPRGDHPHRAGPGDGGDPRRRKPECVKSGSRSKKWLAFWRAARREETRKRDAAPRLRAPHVARDGAVRLRAQSRGRWPHPCHFAVSPSVSPQL